MSPLTVLVCDSSRVSYFLVMPDKHFGTVKLVIFCKQFTTQNFKIFNIDKKVIDNLFKESLRIDDNCQKFLMVDQDYANIRF